MGDLTDDRIKSIRTDRPDKLYLLEALSRTVLLAGAIRTREVLHKIIAMHRAPHS